jgi:hypothetical protein
MGEDCILIPYWLPGIISDQENEKHPFKGIIHYFDARPT